MCGRFALAASPEQLARQFELPLPVPELQPRYNIAPTQPVAVIRIDATAERKRELGITQWGLVPGWAKDPAIGGRMINARAETLTEKPSFQQAFRRRRCLIPATGFYEWRTTPDKKKQPYFILPAAERAALTPKITEAPIGTAEIKGEQRQASELFAFAGLWEIWFSQDGSEVQSCTIITTAANSTMQPLHNRMPVILEQADYAGWLDPDTDRPETLRKYLKQYASEKMRYYPVDRAMNSPRYDAADCMQAVALESDNSLFDEL